MIRTNRGIFRIAHTLGQKYYITINFYLLLVVNRFEKMSWKVEPLRLTAIWFLSEVSPLNHTLRSRKKKGNDHQLKKKILLVSSKKSRVFLFPTCVSLYKFIWTYQWFFRTFSVTAVVSSVFLWNFAREIGAQSAKIDPLCACTTFDRCVSQFLQLEVFLPVTGDGKNTIV